ncbi:CDP-alcohol phosphatidyltransferase [Microbacterium sp. Au-Mic1]|uniref:CDP-alcohol phosphatidyltransferase n=1 Tax=Microbacterium sp. Au-Mic1 TaxID=2906457 RepID=UPI001E44F7E7|nr:CDP-alcohol phosphatidyltransferase [Microbacterium sp. Au-Mic1]MCE4025209.1 CDP-alcohol phosphatidyltransferase [Microbacterium sp. Au-Mic1]
MSMPLRHRSARGSGLWLSPRRGRGAAGLVLAIAALVALPLAPGLLVTDRSSLGLTGLVGIPAESLLIVLLLLILPWRSVRRVLAGIFGVFVTAALALAAIDRGFRATVGTPFVLVDGPQLGSAYGVVVDAVGAFLAELLLVGLVCAMLACATLLAWAALRVADVVRRHAAGRVVTAGLAVVWLVAGVLAQASASVPLAAAASVGAVGATVSRTERVLAEQAAVASAIAVDPFAAVPPSRLLTGLRGKDVVFAFVESYGRVALEGPGIADGVTDVLRAGDASLTAEGYTARSAWLTSPTFGGLSWLAHGTLQTGVWTPTQPAYDQLVASDRLSLTRAFGAAGWRTVSDVPSDTEAWAIGSSFYRYDSLVDATGVGYRGPPFGYARIPDQFTLKHFADTELTGPHDPVMAEIDLVSSHTPWAPLPQLLPWERIGDGSAYDPQPGQSATAGTVWQSPKTVQRFYGQSVQYSLGSLLSFLENVDDPNLVVVVLGDHQPAAIVSGADASRDVPISIIARDPAVFAAIGGWGWTRGLHPGENSPVWRMDAFRNRLLTAFSDRP